TNPTPERDPLLRGRRQLAVRVLAAVLLLFVGADHYYEYSVDQYSVLPTIGALFLANFASATLVGLLLLAPLERLPARFGRALAQVATLSGFAIAATSLAALLVSEQTPLFGFMESNYRPAILVALASEAAASLSLGALFLLERRAGRGRPGPGGGPGRVVQLGSPRSGHQERELAA